MVFGSHTGSGVVVIVDMLLPWWDNKAKKTNGGDVFGDLVIYPGRIREKSSKKANPS